MVRWSFSGIDEMKIGNFIAIAEDLGRPRERWAIAHTVGHHHLHAGNQLWMRAHSLLAVPLEREAEEFARGLLIDEDEAQAKGFTEAWEVAEYFGVPEEMIGIQGGML